MNPIDAISVSPMGDTVLSREGDTDGSASAARESSPCAAACERGIAAAPVGRGCGPAAAETARGATAAAVRRVRFLHTFVVLVLAGACAPAPSDSDGTAEDAVAAGAADAALATAATLEDTLRQRIEEAYDFTQPDIVERMSALYPDTGRVISASGGYVTTTVDSLRQGLADFWTNVGVNMSDARWEWGDVHVDRLSADAAVLTASWSIPHIAPTGQPHTIQGAWTAVFRRMAGEWLIVQEHLSVPPETH
jgi:hypothetical protein